MSGKSPSLLDDTFEILTIDPDGKKFDKGKPTPRLVGRFPLCRTLVSHCAMLMRCVRRAVSRVLGHSDFFGMDMVLDINSDIYPVKARHCAESHAL